MTNVEKVLKRRERLRLEVWRKMTSRIQHDFSFRDLYDFVHKHFDNVHFDLHANCSKNYKEFKDTYNE